MDASSFNSMTFFALNSITPDDGRIFTRGELDREEIENYEILVVVRDAGSPSLSGELPAAGYK